MDKFIESMSLITDTVTALDGITDKNLFRSEVDGSELPNRHEVKNIVTDLQSLLFPKFFDRSTGSENVISQTGLLLNVCYRLTKQIDGAFAFSEIQPPEPAEELCEKFIQRLPEIKNMLIKDIEALYEGDPAAKCREEVLLCYPGYYAISVYRFAHELYELNIPLIPRIMTEYAHERTGVDIHAGAKIGEYFFIDHGTGIVIGETTTIGSHVKLYQGVTLGAKSFELDENGNPVKEIKRHPDIGNNVVIYANATILGGDTKIGDNCIIGGNTWITHPVAAGTVVKY